jgi:transposase, IS6 family
MRHSGRTRWLGVPETACLSETAYQCQSAFGDFSDILYAWVILWIERNILHGHCDPIQMMAFRSRAYLALCALVRTLLAQLPRSGGTDARRWIQHRSHHDLPASVQCYAAKLEKHCRPHLKTTTDSWKVDETYSKIKKTWMYLYRAVDPQGNTSEFLLSSTRDAEAAKRFFLKALQFTSDSAPQVNRVEEQVAQSTVATNAATSTFRVISVDKNTAYPKAIADLKAAGMLPERIELRQIKHLNNLIEQDHRFIKRWSLNDGHCRDHGRVYCAVVLVGTRRVKRVAERLPL